MAEKSLLFSQNRTEKGTRIADVKDGKCSLAHSAHLSANAVFFSRAVRSSVFFPSSIGQSGGMMETRTIHCEHMVHITIRYREGRRSL